MSANVDTSRRGFSAGFGFLKLRMIYFLCVVFVQAEQSSLLSSLELAVRARSTPRGRILLPATNAGCVGLQAITTLAYSAIPTTATVVAAVATAAFVVPQTSRELRFGISRTPPTLLLTEVGEEGADLVLRSCYEVWRLVILCSRGRRYDRWLFDGIYNHQTTPPQTEIAARPTVGIECRMTQTQFNAR